MVYSWTSLWFLWKLPSWLYFLNVNEIVITLAYSLVTNLLESLAVLCAPIALSVILPKRWFYDLFVARGASLAILGLGYMMFLAFQFPTNESYPSLALKPWAVALVFGLLMFLIYVVGRTSFLRKVVEALADRATIFLYVSIPLSLISLLVVMTRMIF